MPATTTFTGIDGNTQIPLWIKNGVDKNCINFADALGRHLSRNLSTSQIRNAYGEVKRIQMKGENNFDDADLLLLKPKLSYARTRNAGARNSDASNAAESLLILLSKGIDSVFEGDEKLKYKRFENFAKFFEAILAYHKSYGGK